jgi:hypothetical protein
VAVAFDGTSLFDIELFEIRDGHEFRISMRMGASMNHSPVVLTMHSPQHDRLVRPTGMRPPNRLAYSPEVPFSPAASILWVKWFPSESFPE